jgi:hypothetical protein
MSTWSFVFVFLFVIISCLLAILDQLSLSEPLISSLSDFQNFITRQHEVNNVISILKITLNVAWNNFLLTEVCKLEPVGWKIPVHGVETEEDVPCFPCKSSSPSRCSVQFESSKVTVAWKSKSPPFGISFRVMAVWGLGGVQTRYWWCSVKVL